MLQLMPADMDPGGLKSTVMKSAMLVDTPSSRQRFTVYETLVRRTFLLYTLPTSKFLNTTAAGLQQNA